MKYTGEKACKEGKCVKVFCDGVELPSVIECDDVENYAIVQAYDGNGSILIDLKTETFVTHRIEGNITVKITDRVKAA